VTAPLFAGGGFLLAGAGQVRDAARPFRERGTKLRPEIAEFIRSAPAASGAVLAAQVAERFGVSLHRRTSSGHAAGEWPAGPQDDKHLLAAARSIGQSPLVMAVHPPRQHTTSRARYPAGTGRGQHAHRLADCDDILDDQARQLWGPRQ
jgi:hypothetical protein